MDFHWLLNLRPPESNFFLYKAFCPDLAAVSTSSKEGAEISQTAIRLYVRRLGGAMICSLPTSRRSFGGFPFSLVALPWKRHQRYAVPVKGNWTSSMLS